MEKHNSGNTVTASKMHGKMVRKQNNKQERNRNHFMTPTVCATAGWEVGACNVVYTCTCTCPVAQTKMHAMYCCGVESICV